MAYTMTDKLAEIALDVHRGCGVNYECEEGVYTFADNADDDTKVTMAPAELGNEVRVTVLYEGDEVCHASFSQDAPVSMIVACIVDQML